MIKMKLTLLAGLIALSLCGCKSTTNTEFDPATKAASRCSSQRIVSVTEAEKMTPDTLLMEAQNADLARQIGMYTGDPYCMRVGITAQYLYDNAQSKKRIDELERRIKDVKERQ